MSDSNQKIPKRPIAVDLFAGAGGMSLGFEMAGFDVLAAVEIDPVHCATHAYNFPFGEVLCRDLTKTTGADIRHNSPIQNQEITVVFGGPPCQGFSLMGKRIIDDPRNSLVFHFIRLVLELKPQFFVMENVKGMALGKHQQFILEVINKLTTNGYKTREAYQVLNAANYGVPQQRERLFLLGCRQDLPLPAYPTAITQPSQKNHLTLLATLPNSLPNSPNVWEAIADLPIIENYPELLHQDWTIATLGQPSTYTRKLRGLSLSPKDFSYPRYNSSGDNPLSNQIQNQTLLTCSSRTNHSSFCTERFAATPLGTIEPISHFYKLHPQGIAHTLRAGTASNRGAFTSPRPIHPVTPRCITVREAARLHSYPDWFRFHATKWHGFRQIGNSVPPLLAQAVAREIIQVLDIVPVKPEIQQNLGDPRLLQFSMATATKHYNVDRHIIEPRKVNPSK